MAGPLYEQVKGVLATYPRMTAGGTVTWTRERKNPTQTVSWYKPGLRSAVVGVWGAMVRNGPSPENASQCRRRCLILRCLAGCSCPRAGLGCAESLTLDHPVTLFVLQSPRGSG